MTKIKEIKTPWEEGMKFLAEFTKSRFHEYSDSCKCDSCAEDRYQRRRLNLK